jgi:hypothetical protein
MARSLVDEYQGFRGNCCRRLQQVPATLTFARLHGLAFQRYYYYYYYSITLKMTFRKTRFAVTKWWVTEATHSKDFSQNAFRCYEVVGY